MAFKYFTTNTLKTERNKIILLTLLVFVAVLYTPSVASLWDLWVLSNSATYSHGSILFLFSLYVFYQRIKSLQKGIQLQTNIFLALLILPVSITWALMVLMSVKVAHQGLFIILFVLAIWTLLGYKNAKYISQPFMIIIFAIPIWEIINQGQMQVLTAAIVTLLLDLTGILVYRDNFDIFIPAGTFTVAENCSGMRQLVVAAPLSLILSQMYSLKWSWTILYFCLSLVVAIISNTLRIFIVVVSGQLTNMQHYFVTEDHVTLGWVVFVIVFSLYAFATIKLFRKFDTIFIKTSKNNTEQENYTQVPIIKMIVVGIVLISGPVFLAYYKAIPETSFDKLPLPSNQNGWVRIVNQDVSSIYVPNFQTGDVRIQSEYIKSDNKIFMDINQFARQRKNKEAINTKNIAYDQKYWHLKSKRKINYDIVDSKKIAVTELMLNSKSDNKSRLVWQWFYISGRSYNDSRWALLNHMLSYLYGKTEIYVYTVSINSDDDVPELRKVLGGFVEDVIYQ